MDGCRLALRRALKRVWKPRFPPCWPRLRLLLSQIAALNASIRQMDRAIEQPGSRYAEIPVLRTVPSIEVLRASFSLVTDFRVTYSLLTSARHLPGLPLPPTSAPIHGHRYVSCRQPFHSMRAPITINRKMLPTLNRIRPLHRSKYAESAEKASPFELRWTRTLKERSARSFAKFFFQQLGADPLLGGLPFSILHRMPDGKQGKHGTCREDFPMELDVQLWPSASR